MTRFTHRSHLCISAALLTLAMLPHHARAQTVYDNGSYIGAINARNISDFAIVDDFTVASSLTFNAIRFYALDTSSGLLPSFSGNLTWFLYSGSAGSPSPNAIPSTNIIAQGTVSPTITNTGDIQGGVANREIAQLDFDIPTQNLSAGTYWLRLKEGTATSTFDFSVIFWLQTGGPRTGNGYRADENEVDPTTWNHDGTNTTNDLAFQLRNTSSASVTPELPGSALLVPALLPVALTVMRKRRNKTSA